MCTAWITVTARARATDMVGVWSFEASGHTARARTSLPRLVGWHPKPVIRGRGLGVIPDRDYFRPLTIFGIVTCDNGVPPLPEIGPAPVRA